MVQATNFILRWLFLCRLVDDRAEVQTWPYRRPGYYDHQQDQQHQVYQQNPQQQQHAPRNDACPNYPSTKPERANPNSWDRDQAEDISIFRESCIRALTLWPPGSTERLQRLDELRLQAVRGFGRKLLQADNVIRWAAVRGLNSEKSIAESSNVADASVFLGGDKLKSELWDDIGDGYHYSNGNIQSKCLLDVDDSIQNDFIKFMHQEHQTQRFELWKRWRFIHDNDEDIDLSNSIRKSNQRQAGESINTSSSPPINLFDDPLQSLSPKETENSIVSAYRLLSETREFLPQLVSVVLHSPPALLPDICADPISSLRSLLIYRCQVDPSLGIELCWLLEAEVGRKWKALFEHRQQTGKRLILIVQADIAQAIATIGAEKASAFNLLQDAEMATAFGMERLYEDHTGRYSGTRVNSFRGTMASRSLPPAPSPRPPRSISHLRCRHFGDSMHFIDRLTQISLDLRHVSPLHRRSHLQDRLQELNRRLCRRMLTRGRISIDVESLDNGEEDVHSHPSFPFPPQTRNAYQSRSQFSSGNLRWSAEHIRADMIQHSIHFPMEPQCICWPGGRKSRESVDSNRSEVRVDNRDSRGDADANDFENPEKRKGAVRALRIVPDQCRLLASRERCPFLVRMEVAETGFDANDARLYAMDVNCVALTVEEALGSTRPSGNSILGDGILVEGGFSPCEIPPELMGRGRNGGQMPEFGSHTYENPNWKVNTKNQAILFPTSGGQGQALESDYQSSFGNVSRRGNKAVFSRGGYQGGDEGFYVPPNMYGVYDTYEMVREQYYEHLHNDMRHKKKVESQTTLPEASKMTGPQSLTMGSLLLDRVFGQPWNIECENLRQRSPYRNVKGWKLASFIIKAGEDIRKEALVMQIMSKLWSWFQAEIPPHLRPFLRPYTIMCVGGDAGLVECLPDVKSINEVKKETDGFTTLRNFFERSYGPPMQTQFQSDQSPLILPHYRDTITFEKARDNFLRSLVGYSVVCYILQIKDRHNANILLDRDGHIMHIDFGFVLGQTPKMGKVPLFSERAPFKLSAEFWEVIGGWSSFKRFCEMFEAAYAVAAAHSDEICSLVEAAIVNVSRNSDLARSMADNVRARLRMKADPKEQKLHIMNIVNDAITSWGTSTYDWLQRSMNGYQ